MKRRYVVAAVVASGAILAGAVVGILTYQPAPTQIVQAASRPTTESGVVYDAPGWVRKGTFSMGQASGRIDEVYGVATTTLEHWLELEPGYSSAIKLTEQTRNDPVYAAFVRGRWAVVGAITHSDDNGDPIIHYFEGGRVVLDKDRMVLNVQLWDGEIRAKPAFGPFNDQ